MSICLNVISIWPFSDSSRKKIQICFRFIVNEKKNTWFKKNPHLRNEKHTRMWITQLRKIALRSLSLPFKNVVKIYTNEMIICWIRFITTWVNESVTARVDLSQKNSIKFNKKKETHARLHAILNDELTNWRISVKSCLQSTIVLCCFVTPNSLLISYILIRSQLYLIAIENH